MNPPRTSPHLLLKRLLRLGLAAVLVTAVVFGVLGIMPAQAITPTNGMSASLVLGQANFTSNSPATTQTGMTNPTGIAVDPTTSKVFVADYINSRILRFASVASLSNGAAAEAVLGQPNFTSNALTTTQNGMWNPQDVYVDSAGRLWVADEGNHRVLRFDSAASKANGANADGVLGQADFTSRNAATTQDGMKFPGAVVVDSSGHLWVKDQDNHRVLRFDNAASKLNGANADGVLGQADFVSAVQGPTQNRMRYPRHIAVDSGGRLWVADNGSRVLRFDDAASKANGANADGVLGQVDFTSAVYATTQTGMNNTAGIAIDNTGRLYESELNTGLWQIA
jgi:DNA-binding beta-propeller fold protein YncE